ncbi:MAG: hypothetical protein WB608_01385 [Terracidiphilus sp.]
MLSNITVHWKTSLSGVLLAVLVAAPILEKVDWSHISAASVFQLTTALATAFLGLLAKDPS